MKLFKKREKRAESTVTGAVQFSEDFYAALTADNSITRKEAAEIPAVQACVELLAGIVSALPLKLYEERDGRVTEIKNDPRTRLINGDTGDVLNGTAMRRLWVRDFFLGGGAYAYIERDEYAFPKALYYAEESRVSAVPNGLAIYKDYSLVVDGRVYPKSDFVKILRNSKGTGRGVSVGAECGTMLLTAYNTMQYENSVVKKGGNKKGFFTSQQQLSKGAMDLMKSAWRKMFSNSPNVEDNVCVLNEGMDYKETSATALEMQLNENKRTNSDELCSLFGVPPEILSGNASEQVRENFITNALTPLLNTFEAAFDSDLLLEREKGLRYFAFDTRELTRGDILKRYNAYAVGMKNGFLQLDDVRSQEDLPPIKFPYIKLGLNDVLYDPDTGAMYTPNTNAAVNLQRGGIAVVQKAAENAENALQEEERGGGNPYHNPKNGQFTNSPDGGIDKSGNGGIIKAGSGSVTANDVENAGAYSGAKKTPGWQERHAERMYEEIRHRTGDVRKIAENTMFTEKAVGEIKQHMFFDEHKFGDGSVKRFDSDFDQAQAWDRLSQGKGTDLDVEMLKHEYIELTQMRLHNYDYETAHAIANEKYNWWAMANNKDKEE